MNLHILYEITKSGYKLEWIFILGLLATILAIFTIVSKNPIHSVLYLIGLFLIISLYLIISNMTFIAISYLLVYVGAISILFLFILMLINVRISELTTEERNSTILAILVVLVFGFAFHNKLPYIIDVYADLSNYMNRYDTNTIYDDSSLITYLQLNYAPAVSSKDWDGSLIEITHISGIGNLLYNVLFMNMMIIAIILLLAMVGAIVITVKPKDKLQESNKESIVSMHELKKETPNYMNISPFSNKI